MNFWKKLMHLLPSVRRVEDDDIREELETLRSIAAPGELGNLTLAAENARSTSQWPSLESLIQDLRYASRSMWHDKVFSLLAVASLALGIGASTAIYSFMDSVLLRSLPVSQPESLVIMKWRAKSYALASEGMSWSTNDSTSDAAGTISSIFPYPALQLFRDSHDVLSSAFGYFEVNGLNVSVGNETDEATGHYVSGNYFTGIGVGPSAGRVIQTGDDRVGSASVVVVSQRFGRRRFGDPNRAVGQVIRINDKPFDVVGVVPASFYGAEPGAIPDLYLPMRAQLILGWTTGEKDYESQHFYWLEIMARLQPGVSVERAQATLAPRFQQFVASTAINDRQRQDLPQLRLQTGATGLDSLRLEFSQPIYVLMAVVGAILLIACSNIANLLLARASARRREIAIRLSIGASRVRVIRQLLTESTLLSAVGGAVGIGLAWWSVPVLTLLLSNGRTNFTLHAELNWRVLSVTVFLSFVTGLLFGLVPALQATRVDLSSSLKATPTVTPGRGRSRVGIAQWLVVAQVVLSLLLLVGAGLFARTLANLQGIDVGFNRDNVLLFSIRPSSVGIPAPARNQLYEDVRTRLRALPSVTAVSLSSQALPMGGGTMAQMAIVDVPAPVAVDGRPPSAVLMSVGPEFFSTMQIPVVAGREFTDRDRAGAPRVMMVNRMFGHAFGVENPTGQTVSFHDGRFTIVGVVDDTLNFSLKGERHPIAYFPYLQADRAAGGMVYAVRTASRPLNLAVAVAAVVRAADWRLAVLDMKTQTAHIDHGISREITLARLCSTFAAIALVIACVGLYGTVAFNVARRTNEIGIRMALGASGSRIVWMVLRGVMLMIAAGLAIGLPLALLGTRYVSSFLYGVEPNDSASIALAVFVMSASAVLAGLLPARRAAGTAPMLAVRNE